MYAVLIGIEVFFETEEKAIEIASNSQADFLEQIHFSGEVPPELVCPITQCIMHDPVRIFGEHPVHVFERTALQKWIIEGKNSNPLTRQPLALEAKLIPANDIAEKIKMWLHAMYLRRHVFSIWSRGKIAGNSAVSNPPDSAVLS